jgi:carbamoyl-phosphate synthase large subunit
VLVTGIGGHPGQGVLRNLRALSRPLRIIGTDINAATAGHYFCDAFHRVPYAYETSFADTVAAVCRSEDVQLVIPVTDYEAYHLALIRDRLPPLAGPSAAFAKTCLDKYETHKALRSAGIPFVDTVLPSEYGGGFTATIVKPREGRGSRDVHVDPPNARGFDDTFVVQQRLVGPELTTALYVDRKGALTGHITFERTLFHGYTLRANVDRAYEREISSIVEMLVRAFEIRGPCNIQSIGTRDGPVPFELNARYSAICSFSSRFGFPDVEYAVEEHLFDAPLRAPAIIDGCVYRTLFDIVYEGGTCEAIAPGRDGPYIL